MVFFHPEWAFVWFGIVGRNGVYFDRIINWTLGHGFRINLVLTGKKVELERRHDTFKLIETCFIVMSDLNLKRPPFSQKSC